MPNPDYTQPRLLPQANAGLFPLSAPAAEGPPAELAQPQKQALLCATLATVAHFFGPPERWLAGIDDPRDRPKTPTRSRPSCSPGSGCFSATSAPAAK